MRRFLVCFSVILGLSLQARLAHAQNDTDQDFFKDTPAQTAPVGTQKKTIAPDKAAPEKNIETTTSTPSNPHEDLAPDDDGKVFDWSKHQGESEVAHPFASKGLTRITKDLKYIYDVKESPQKYAVSAHFGMIDLSNLSNPEEGGQPSSSFADNYDSPTVPAVFIDYEWQLWRPGIGKLGLTAGSGVIVAQGNGHFVHPDLNPGKSPQEVFTFLAFPLSIGAVYRLKIWDNQLFVPYAAGGISGFGFTELRDDNKSPKFGGSAATYFAAGTAINVTYFDKISRLTLDREYGINRMYFFGEYRALISLSNRYDFSSDYINGGLLMEF